MTENLAIGLAAGLALLTVAALATVVARCRRLLRADQALVVARLGGERVVAFESVLVLPALHRAEELSLATVVVEVSLGGANAPRYRDRLRVDVTAAFYVRVNRTSEDVLRVAAEVGCARASEPGGVRSLFVDRFASALHTSLARLDAEAALTQREDLRDLVVQTLGPDLGGFVLDDVAFTRLALVPIEELDPDDPLDAEALAPLLRRAATAKAEANELRRRIAAEQLAANLEILRLEGHLAEARAKQQAEIAVMEARERGATERVELEEQAKTAATRARLALEAKGGSG